MGVGSDYYVITMKLELVLCMQYEEERRNKFLKEKIIDDSFAIAFVRCVGLAHQHTFLDDFMIFLLHIKN